MSRRHRAAGWSSPRTCPTSRLAPRPPGSTSRPWCRWTAWCPGTSTTRSPCPTSRRRWPRWPPPTPATTTPVLSWTAPRVTNCSGTPARNCRTWPAEPAGSAAPGRPGRPGQVRVAARLSRDLVEEPEHGGQPTVAAGHRDVEPDDDRLRALGAEAPGEPGLPVVAVHRAEQGETEAGELFLHRGDGGVDGLAPGRLAERVGVARVRGPYLVDELAAQARVGLVPAGDVPLDDFTHRIPPRVCRFGVDGIDGAGPGGAVSITCDVTRQHDLAGNRPAPGRPLRSLT